MTKKLSVSIDIGTTGCRVELFDTNGTGLERQTAEYPLEVPHSGWAEQDPERIYTSLMGCLRKLSLENVGYVVLSSVFHSFIPIDREKQPLGLMWTWADTRSTDQAARLKLEMPGAYARTGCPTHPMYYPARILWLKEKQPEVFARVYRFVGIKEYILERWTGAFLVDRSIASGTGLYNFVDATWDQDLLHYLGLSPEVLSPVMDTEHMLEIPSRSPVAKLGLQVGCKVMLGAGDGVFANLGAGGVRKGQVTATIGTSGALRILVPEPKIDAFERTWCYNLSRDWWVAGGAINNGGLVYRWVRDQFMSVEAEEAEALGLEHYEMVNRRVLEVAPGANGLIFLPYLTGERSPRWNADARGVILGLGLQHSRHHIARAAIEGVAFRMFSVFEVLAEIGGPLDEIRFSGGALSSLMWQQTMADVFQRTIFVPKHQGTTFGAWIFLQHVLGNLSSLLEAEQFMEPPVRCEPRREYAKLYHELYSIYNETYDQLQKQFSRLAKLQRGLY